LLPMHCRIWPYLIQAVADSARNVEHLLRKLLARHGTEDTPPLNMQQLASRALQSGLIDARLTDSINGLGMMRLLAAMDQDRLTPERAAEFVNLSAVIAYLIELAGRAPDITSAAAPGRTKAAGRG
jgi:hypothetical protein